MIRYVDKNIQSTFPAHYPAVLEEASAALKLLLSRSGKGKEYLGWLDLPTADASEMRRLQESAAEIRDSGDLLVCVGIGGSYLGAKAFIHALRGEKHRIRFAGQHLSPLELNDLLGELKEKDFYINVISKSGTTTEPGVAFRILKAEAEKKYGKNAAKRIIATTDARKGALRRLADEIGYRSFAIPDDVGGRFSVLSPVGLLPLFAAGLDADQILRAALAGFKTALADDADNPALRYAAARNVCYREGKGIEILANFEPRFHYLSEWWKQLCGESEGKEGKGIFPASANFTTDLHSLGQWIQEGTRSIFETFLVVDHYQKDITIPRDPQDGDGLNYIAGLQLGYVNEKAFKGTRAAHESGGVPTSTFHLDYPDEEHLSKLIVIFETAVAVSGYMMGINPFDQPGVEAYKHNMFRLLGKPGY
ncbi:MAG: glucose-6-phosphate isomerase [Candidatus Neomarinimicrobiota bacterium]|jgi:glucose-6-phosphate isomerase|nr:glucose-6-phosphate isomerase [Candidatus Neomarinimicrobiota bacterium]MDX9781253.1 glucose-6-phosphate isomerase [bacterium]